MAYDECINIYIYYASTSAKERPVAEEARAGMLSGGSADAGTYEHPERGSVTACSNIVEIKWTCQAAAYIYRFH